MRVTNAIVFCALLVSLGLTALNAQTSPPASVTPLNVLTFHNNNQRLGLNSLETTLTLGNVNPTTFGKVNFLPADGQVFAVPLYVSNVTINGKLLNVVYVATEHDSVYAFDADTGIQLWKTSTLLPGEVPSADPSCTLVQPEIGITGTPVIDLQAGKHGLIYVVATSNDGNQSHQRLHALDLVTGAEWLGGPVEITGKYPGTGDGSQGGFVIFDPAQYLQRAALLNLNHKIYIVFGSRCDRPPYTGWIMQYNAWSLEQLSVLDITPNGKLGAIWQSAGGPAADSDGNFYLLTGNGTFDTNLDGNGFPVNGDYGNALIKVSGETPMKVLDYFSMYNTVEETDQDLDFGSGGPIVVDFAPPTPNQPPVPVVIAAGKDTNIYVANRYHMGKWNPLNNDGIYQELDGVLSNRIFSTPAVFNNTIYYGPENGQLTALRILNGFISGTPTSQSSAVFGVHGTTPSVSSNGGSNGIVWASSYARSANGVLHAYDARDLTKELWNSNLAGSRDQYGLGSKFVTPMVANGRVYLSTRNPAGVAVFGLLGSSQQGEATTAKPAAAR